VLVISGFHTWNNFAKNCLQFGHAFKKIFTSSDLHQKTIKNIDLKGRQIINLTPTCLGLVPFVAYKNSLLNTCCILANTQEWALQIMLNFVERTLSHKLYWVTYEISSCNILTNNTEKTRNINFLSGCTSSFCSSFSKCEISP
jgi:hypothetical protein